MTETILRVAAKGDGVTTTGRHLPLTAPGDIVLPNGTVQPGPHRAIPPCRHFGRCGGCQLQHLDEAALTGFVQDRVTLPAEALAPEVVSAPHLSPPRTRRRATLHASGGSVGFREAASHRIIDMRECHVLAPELFAAVAPLRRMLGKRGGKHMADITLTLTDQGLDCAIKGLTIEGLDQTERLIAFAEELGLARLVLDQGYGPETFREPQPVTVTLGGTPVHYPAGGFLQATPDGEAALVAAAREWLAGAGQVADLFAGLGTFALALAADGTRVTAVEAARDAHLACRAAANRHGLLVEAVHRDLFRSPLRTEELARFDAVLLDPPRAGAREQVVQLAESGVARIVYVSCNPASWAKDAVLLVAAGYRLAELRPVGQFRWSTHVELASLFVR
jgi:23S rRNA (uracil1939-C5)-methyltransferase